MKPRSILNLHGFGKPLRYLGPDDDLDYWLPWDSLPTIGGLAKKYGLSVTIDDGEMSAAEAALTLKKDWGISVIVFPTASKIGEEGYLTAQYVRYLADSGIEIGSHSLNHERLPRLGPEELHHALKESKKIIREITGEPVEKLALPFGFHSQEVIEAARQYYRWIYSSGGFAGLQKDICPIRRKTVTNTNFTDLPRQLEASDHYLYRLYIEAKVIVKSQLGLFPVGRGRQPHPVSHILKLGS